MAPSLCNARSRNIIINILMAVGSDTPLLKASNTSCCCTTATRLPKAACNAARESAGAFNSGMVTMT